MTARNVTDDYRALFLTHTPMIDLRAPAELARGAFPGACSLPLMSDDERASVGTCYKHDGQDAAIALGHQLVSGDLKAARLAQWLDFTQRYPQGVLYCWRGGLRSQTVQQWLADSGVDYPRVVGGYKAMRTYLLNSLHDNVEQLPFVLVSGKTGTGKTRVIERLMRVVDLEGLANHRGSSFGQLPSPQPAQIDFENSVSIALLRLRAANQLDQQPDQQLQPVLLEDEGRLVGRVSLPEPLRLKMKQAPMVIVEEPLQSRVDVVLEDYVVDLGKRYVRLHGEMGLQLHAEKMLADLGNIKKRLGGDRFMQVHTMMQSAFRQQLDSGDTDPHRHWIAYLLEQYYDPMYQYQLERREGEQLFVGDRAAVLDWATEQEKNAIAG